MANNFFSNKITIFFLLVISLLLLILFSLSIGTVYIPFKKVLYVLTHVYKENSSYIIIWKLRFPRIVMAIIAGGTLAAIGGSLQALFRNPLADPYIIGISSGAALGATLSFFLQRATGIFFNFYLPFFAFLGALIAMFFVYRLSKIGTHIVIENLLLSGVIIGFISSALITLIIAFAGREVHEILFWLMGDLSRVTWGNIFLVLIPIILGIIILLNFSLSLNAISLGEEVAYNLGINPERLKKTIFFISSFLVGLVVSFTGIIGFVGLIIPHITRLLVGTDHRVMLPTSIFLGSIFLLLCDDISRTIISPRELPIGVITSLIGAPLFIYLLKKSRL